MDELLNFFKGNKLQSTILIVVLLGSGSNLMLKAPADKPLIFYVGMAMVISSAIWTIVSIFMNLKVEGYESLIKTMRDQLKDSRSHNIKLAQELERSNSGKGTFGGSENKFTGPSDQTSTTKNG